MVVKLADSAVLESAIAEFLEAESSGQPLSRDAFLEQHHEIRCELESFLVNHDAMLAVAAPLHEAIGQEFAACRPPEICPTDATLDASDPAAIGASQAHARDSLVRLGTYGDYELLRELGRG